MDSDTVFILKSQTLVTSKGIMAALIESSQGCNISFSSIKNQLPKDSSTNGSKIT